MALFCGIKAERGVAEVRALSGLLLWFLEGGHVGLAAVDRAAASHRYFHEKMPSSTLFLITCLRRL